MTYSPGPVTYPRATPISIGCHSNEAVGFELASWSANAPSSANYPGAANAAIYVPFGIAEPLTVVKMWLLNGAAVAGNVDLGIYRADFTRVLSTGATAQAGTTAIQEFDVTDTVLAAGRYYLGISSDTSGGTQNMLCWTPTLGAGTLSAMGVLMQATAHALPNPMVPVTATVLAIPDFGFTARTLF